MEIYLIVFFMSLVLALGYPRTNVFGAFVFMMLLFLSMFRGEFVGIDTTNYYNNIFSGDKSPDADVSNHDFEILFIAVCDFITEVGLDSRCCIYFLSIITFLFLELSSKVYDVSLLFVCFFYLLFNDYSLSLNIARQMAACSIALYAYSYLDYYDLRKYLFFVFILLAASIHASAIFFSLLYFLRNISFHRFVPELKLIAIVISSYAFLLVFKTIVLDRIMNSLGLISIYSALGEETMTTSLSFMGFIYRAIGLVIGLHIYSEMKDRCWNIVLDVFLLGIVVRVLLSPFYGNVLRLGLYLYIVDVIVYSLYFIYYYRRSNNLRLLEFLCVVGYFSVEFVGALTGNIYETVPYVLSL